MSPTLSAVRNRQKAIGLWSVSLLTALMGLINLLSAATPSLPDRVAWLRDVLPLEVRVSGRLFAAVSGFFLLMLAANLLRRKRLAWGLTVGLLIVSIVSHLVKGLDFEESGVAIVLLVQLVLMRGWFTAQSDRPSIAQGVRTLVGALLFTLAYGTVGFWAHDRYYTETFNLGEALVQTLAMFFTADNAGLRPTTHAGKFFADSIYWVGAITLLSSAWMLFRPVLFRRTAEGLERSQAKEIVTRYGASSLAQFALLPDKSYYFSPSRQSVVAFVPKGRGAIALGDPIGPTADREAAIAGFRAFCDRNDWHPAFYQTLPDSLELYQKQGFQTVKIGEEAIVDLNKFTLQGKPGRHLRASVNKFNKQGTEVVFYPPPVADELLKELRQISDEWLQHMSGSEKRFSLGWFDDDYLRECEIAVVETDQGKRIAFANIVPEYQLNDITIDLMRHRADVESGAMDFLFISMFQHFKERKFDGFNLGLSVLSGVGDAPSDNRLEKGLHYLSEHMERFYGFQGLHAYKDKFHPCWEPRYLVYPRLSALPDVVVALVRADSGDRLLDYFKPGA